MSLTVTRLLLRVALLVITLQLAVGLPLPTSGVAADLRSAYVVHARTTADATAAAAAVHAEQATTFATAVDHATPDVIAGGGAGGARTGCSTPAPRRSATSMTGM